MDRYGNPVSSLVKIHYVICDVAIDDLVDTPLRAAYAPLHSTSPADDPSVRNDLSRTGYTPLFTVNVLYICIARIKSVYSFLLY